MKLIENLYNKNYKNKPKPKWILKNTMDSFIKKDSILLDYGAGIGNSKALQFRGKAKKICGVDVDETVLKNPHLDEGKLLQNGTIPYPNDYFDVVFASWVLEHLPNPEFSFAEISRVLKPNGHFFFLRILLIIMLYSFQK